MHPRMTVASLALAFLCGCASQAPSRPLAANDPTNPDAPEAPLAAAPDSFGPAPVEPRDATPSAPDMPGMHH
ncbi:MAG TPA: hypothetical protein VFC46_09810, partial [Humisphaera sp.]|nr:hypothetical protein [Humisphaera sp.]